MYLLDQSLWFPDTSEAMEDGLLALGGDLSLERLLLAYRSGIFPWYSEGQPILWWSPDPRMVLFPDEFKVSKSLARTVASDKFRVTVNTCFEDVIRNCATVPRRDQEGTWITEAMIVAYCELHQVGHATSVEVWSDDTLVGGLYGIDLPELKVFCGESMFSHERDASKVGFHYWVTHLQKQEYRLIDCQVYTEHLERFGAREISREVFLEFLRTDSTA